MNRSGTLDVASRLEHAVVEQAIGWRVRRLDTVRVVAAATGVVSSLYLVWVELFRLDAICLWCTVVHVLTFALWVAVLFGQILSGPADE